jgi:hypothetical protein
MGLYIALLNLLQGQLLVPLVQVQVLVLGLGLGLVLVLVQVLLVESFSF